MKEVPFHVITEAEAGEKFMCSACFRTTDEIYCPILEGLDDEDRESLEKIANARGFDIIEFGLCLDCFVNAQISTHINGKRRLKLVLDERELLDIIEKAGPFPSFSKETLEYLSREKCPVCGKDLEVNFEYLTESEEWKEGYYFPLKRYEAFCRSCNKKISVESKTASPIGFLTVGEILDFNEKFLKLRVIPPPPLKKELTIAVEHRVNPKVLSELKEEGELAEFLIIRNRVVRVYA